MALNIKIDGKTYHDFDEVSKVTGISSNTLRSRWYAGKRKISELTAQPKPSARGGKYISVDFDGQTFNSLAKLADYAGLSRQLVYTRYNRGKRIDTGLLAPKRESVSDDE